MLIQLEDYLKRTQAPEMFSLYDRANTLFDLYDLEDYQLGYQDLLTSVDGEADGWGDPRDESVYQLTMQYLDQILDEHQFILTDEATMEQRIQVLEFIRAIEQTELIEECYEALNCEEFDNIDKVARCMLHVSSISEEDSMTFLREIPDCVVRTMGSYFHDRIVLESQTETLDPAVRDIYREMDKYARAIKGQEMRSYKYLFEEEGIIGLPFEFYYQNNEAYLLGLPIQAMVYECIGFALLSENGMSNPQETIMACLGNQIADLEQMTKIQYEISKTLLDYRKEVASGIGLVV